MSVKLLGVSEFTAALSGMVATADIASRAAVAKGGHLIEAETKRKLTESHRSSNPGGRDSRGRFTKGEHHASPPGQPPALVTGQLRRSVTVTGPTRIGARTWTSSTGPTAVYGRIQELGGVTGHGGATVLPPRPYLAPALNDLLSSGRLAAVFVDAWRAATRR